MIRGDICAAAFRTARMFSALVNLPRRYARITHLGGKTRNNVDHGNAM